MIARFALLCAGLLPLLASAATPPLSDVIERVDEEEYLVKIRGQITAYQDDIDARIQWDFQIENTPLVFPIVPDGGFHEIDMDRLKTVLRLNDNEASDYFALVPTDSLDTTFARYFIKEFKGKQVEFQLEEYITCWASKVDEEEALRIGWPEEWASEVASALQPQVYIESSSETVVQLLDRFTGGKARSVNPYVLAKELARRTVSYFQPSGARTTRNRVGAIDGIEVYGAKHAIEKRRGPEHDAVCLYVALCRAAGLPARPVIGLDTRDRDRIISWAEVFVPTAGWVPVDLRELYDSPGRTRDVMKPWPGVGTYKELNEMVPVAHHFHPPAGVFAAGLKGKPLLWGWRPYPQTAPARQTLFLDVDSAPKRGGEADRQGR